MSFARKVALLLLLAGCGVATLEENAASVDSISQEAVMSNNGIRFSNGFNLGNGTVLSNGVTLGNGFNLGNGLSLPNGFNLGNGLSLPNGFNLGNGFTLGNGTVLPDGWGGPYIRPPSGSDLEKWIDQDPANQLRMLRYMTECAMPNGYQVRVYYRGAIYPFYGKIGLGVSWAVGADGYAGTSDDGAGLTVVHQEKVTACLLSRVNARKDSMGITLLGNMAPMNQFACTDVTNARIDEAGFYGNIFLPTPEAFMCLQGEVMDYRRARACRTSATTYNCGIIKYAGPCYNKLPNSNEADPNKACNTKTRLSTPSCNGTYSTESVFHDCANPSRTKRYAYAISADLAEKPDGAACLDSWECIAGHRCSSSGVCVND